MCASFHGTHDVVRIIVVRIIVAMGGSDCEMIREGWLAQPANAWSSVAYLAGATYVLARHRLARGWTAPPVAVGAGSLAVVGLGSFLYHGPQPAWGEAAHDVGITALLVALIGLRASRGAHTAILAAVALVATAAAPSPLVHGTLGALVAVAALRGQRRGPRRPDAVVAAVAVGVAGLLFLVGRTGGPLCSPSSLAQPHAGWHILTAIAAAVVLAQDPRAGIVPRPPPDAISDDEAAGRRRGS
jgi:hypothetical protein